MKQRKNIFTLSFVLLTFLICSCGTPAYESDLATEQTEQLENINTEPNVTEPNVTEPDVTEPTPQSWEDVLALLFLPIDTAEDPNWESKINIANPPDPSIKAVFDGKVYENGKYCVYISIVRPSAEHTARYKEALHQYNHIFHEMTDEEIEYTAHALISRVYYPIYTQAFIDQYITDQDDIFYTGEYTGNIVLYASREEVEQYAKCSMVAGLISGDSWLEAANQPLSPH